MSIQQRRIEKGWSQEDLALHSGLSTRTIQRIESGQSIGLESLKCLAAVFEVSTSVIVQEQNMASSSNTDEIEQVKLSKIEKEAIMLGKSLFKGSKKGQADPLNKTERDAIDYGKRLLEKFKL